MLSSGHRCFGEVFCDKFGIPDKYKIWARAPDFGYWLKDRKWNYYLHRFTLHGYPNSFNCIKLFKNDDRFPYDEDYCYEISVLVRSHTYLDLFNSFLVPSYPNSADFKYIKEQHKTYLEPMSDDPDNIKEIFEEVLDSFTGVSDLDVYFTNEFTRLPEEKTFFTEKIIEGYKNG